MVALSHWKTPYGLCLESKTTGKVQSPTLLMLMPLECSEFCFPAVYNAGCFIITSFLPVVNEINMAGGSLLAGYPTVQSFTPFYVF